MIKDLLKPLIIPALKDITGSVNKRIFNFNLNTYGIFAKRLVNIEQDNTFIFWVPPQSSISQVILSQTESAIFNQREFQIYVENNTSRLSVILGGQVNSVDIQPGKMYRLDLVEVGRRLRLFDSQNNLLSDVQFFRGTAREPLARTILGGRMDGTNPLPTYRGPMPDISVNGVYYPLDDVGKRIQLQNPDLLGSNLINENALQNPFLSQSQWNYLGEGRWSYNGDGSINELTLINPANQPNACFVEFEVESISGVMRCFSNTISTGQNQSDPVFSSTGIFRWYINDRSFGAGDRYIRFQRHIAGSPASCVIKNIKIHALNQSNPLTLFNVNNSNWM